MIANISKKNSIRSKKLNYSLAFISCLVFIFLIAGFSLASTADEIKAGFDKTSGAAGYKLSTDSNANVFAKAWSTYINSFVAIISALFVVIIIYSGFLWLTARGREEQVTRAKTWMLQATIGLAIIVGARILVELVFYYLGNAIGQK